MSVPGLDKRVHPIEEILRWILLIPVPYLAACFLGRFWMWMFHQIRFLLSAANIPSQELPWLDAVLADWLSCMIFVMAGTCIAPRFKLVSTIVLACLTIYFHIAPKQCHQFFTATVLGPMPSPVKDLLGSATIWTSDHSFALPGAVLVGLMLTYMVRITMYNERPRARDNSSNKSDKSRESLSKEQREELKEFLNKKRD
ncbi:MAG: hypothetical protein K2Z81_09520 [Cyanobacteria bacterium]|nr:hypothetical protein [Cyanobacteriota bacterium]